MKIFENLKRKMAEKRQAKPSTVRAVKTGLVLATKTKVKLATLLAAFACCVIALVLGLSGLFGGSSIVDSEYADAADATASRSYIVLDDGSYSKVGTLYPNGLKALYRGLTNDSTCQTYSAFLEKLNKSTRTLGGTAYAMYSSYDWRKNHSDQNLKISFGGYDWLLGAVSKASRKTDGTYGDGNRIILTLVMADDDNENLYCSDYAWSNAYKVASVKYPCTTYGTSIARSMLVYGTYVSNYTGDSVSQRTMTTDYTRFSETYKNYLVAPKYVGWQQNESGSDLCGDAHGSLANEAYGTSYGGNRGGNYGLSGVDHYSDWKNDLIWLPSYSEMGLRNDDAVQKINNVNTTYKFSKSVFQTDKNFRSASNIYWTRSQSCGTAYQILAGGKAGKYTGTNTYNATTYRDIYLRPAIHVDLYALAQRTSNTSTSATQPAWGYNQAGFYRASDNELWGVYTGEKQSAKLSGGTLFSGSSRSVSDGLTYSADTNAFTTYSANVTYDTSISTSGNNYKYCYVRPKSGYYWSDGGTDYCYFSIKLYRQVLNLTFDKTAFTYNGSQQAPSITQITSSAPTASHVTYNMGVGNSYLPSATDFSFYYEGTTAAGNKYASSTKPSEAGEYTMRVTIKDTKSYRTNFSLWNDIDASPEKKPSTDSYQQSYSFVINYGDMSPTISVYSGTYDGRSHNLLNSYSVTLKNDITPTWSYSTDSTNGTNGTFYTLSSSSYPSRTNAGSQDFWIKITATGYNTFTRKYTASIAKRSLTSADLIWSTISSYDYTGSAITSPKPTVTAIKNTVNGSKVETSVSSSATNDFDYKYTNNTNAALSTATTNAPTITITAKNTSTNFTGSTTKTFTINKAKVTVPYWSAYSTGVSKTNPSSTTTTSLSATYTGSQMYGVVNATNSTLISWTKSSTNLTFEYTNDKSRYVYFTNASGTDTYGNTKSYYVYATLRDTNHQWTDGTTGNKYLYIYVAKKSISSGVGWETVSSQTYTGDPITPKPIITSVGSVYATSTNPLSSTSDFTYTYISNTNVGEATIKIKANTGSTNYTGETEIKFSITSKSIPIVYWQSTQDTGITIDGKKLTATFNGKEFSFKAYQPAGAPSPNITSIDGKASTYSNNVRTYYATNAGTYKITYALSSGQVWSDNTTASIELTIEISKARASLYAYTSNAYTGNSNPIEFSRYTLATEVENAPEKEDLFYISSYVSDSVNDGTSYNSATAPTKAGTYKAYTAIKSEYANNYSGGGGFFNYTITRAYVTVTWNTSSFDYTGSAQYPTFTLSFPVSVVTSARPTDSNFTYSTSTGNGISPGSHTRKAVLATSYAYNFQITGNSTNIDNSSYTNTYCTYNFTIGNQEIEKPYWMPAGSCSLSSDKLTVTANFNNANQQFYIYETSTAPGPSVKGTGASTTWSGTTRTITVKNAGTYVFTYSIKNNSSQRWTDGTNTDVVLTLKINNIKVSGVEVYGLYGLVYNGKQQGGYAADYYLSREIENKPAVSNLIDVLYTGTTISDVSYRSTAKPVDAGTYVARFSLVSDLNYEMIGFADYDGGHYWSYEFTIAQRDLADPVVGFSYIYGGMYNGSAYTPKTIVNSINGSPVSSAESLFTYSYANNINAGEAKVTVSAKANTNYKGKADVKFFINKYIIERAIWDKTVFTYNGKVQGPNLIDTLVQVPLNMFDVSSGQINAGTYIASATLKPQYANNYELINNGMWFRTEYTIEKANLELGFDNEEFTYNGLEQLPDFTLTTNSGVNAKNEMAYSVIARSGSHLTNGTAIDVGRYTIQVSMAGDLDVNYIKRVGGVAAADGNWTIDFEILPCNIKPVWSATKFDYNGEKQSTKLTGFTGKPANGSDPFNNLKVTYYSNGVALTGTPVHAGNYTVKVEIADSNYRLVNASNAVISAATQSFVINSVSFEAKGGGIKWENINDIIFNGLPQGVMIDGYTTGLFAADRSRALNLQILYAEVAEDGKAGAFTAREFTNAGNYMIRVVDSFGDYTFNDVPFTIAKRKVIVEWKGDEKSRRDGDTIIWLYDGEEHSPEYSVKFDGIDPVYRDGVKVSNLEITYGSFIDGASTLSAQLVDNGYNSNFEITEESKTQKIKIEQFIAVNVEWYEDGSSTPLTEMQLAGLHYETSKVYGKNGPKLRAVAKTDFVTDNGVITGEIVLDVSYPVSFDGYWEISDTRYKAIATFGEKDIDNCSFSDALLKDDEGVKRVFTSFLVTDDRIDFEKLTVTWAINVDDEEIDINDIGAFNYEDGYGWRNGVFTFLYDGTERYPYPFAIGEYNERIELAVGGTENCVNAGTGHIVYIVPLSGYEVAVSDSEYSFNIVPRPVVVEWFGASSIMFGDDPDKFIEVEADGELSTCRIASGDSLLITFDSLNVGTRTATARVFRDGVLSENYVLTNNTKQITITRRPVSVSSIDWSKTLEFGATAAVDEAGNTYYVFMNDGTVHAPVAELIVSVHGVPMTVKLTVMGEQSATGSYIAYAILDYRDEYSSNFLLVVDETEEQLVETVASQRFDIAKMVIDRIIWTTDEDAEETEKLTYEYDGKEHIPYAVGVTAEGYRAVLTVWGAQTDAGDYTARVTDDCDFTEAAKEKLTVEFSILAQEVSVEWLGYNENNEIHLTYDGTAKHPEVNVGGDLTEDDYYVTGFVNAGTYVANIVFTNPNYTLGEGSDANCEFIIDRRAVNVSWTGVGNHTPSGAEAGVMYWEYNGTQRGPVASATYGDIKFGEDLANRIIVSGRETDVGSYTATATLDYSVLENANYTLVNATKRFVITPYEIHVIWTGNEEADGAFEWEFDGTPYNPTAKYQLWNSGEDEWITPEKIMGAKSDVGEYIASIELPANCAFAVVDGKSCGEQSFRITKMKITKINWFASAEEGAEPITDIENFMFEYTGKAQLPLAFADGTGVELMVTGARINAGSGYIATATLKEAGNYELGANANSTFMFGISEKAVKITWNDTSDKESEFTWSYTGDLICPTAEFTDIEGNVVAITVTGSNVNVGTYRATAHDTFLNYYFVDDEGNEIVPTQLFTIDAKTLSLGDEFKWLPNGGTFTPAAEGGYDTYTFGYDGKVHQPTVECTINGKTIIFSYTISSESGSVTAMVNAGTYTLTAKSSDGNYTIPNEKVTVVITPKEVSVVWGATQLEYTGSAQTPEAYYVDVNGQTIALAVTSETPVTTGKGKATATFAETDNVYGNYTLAAEEPKEFEVKSASTGTLKWDWATGKFIFVPATDSDTSADDCWTSENAALMPSKQTLTADDRREA